MKKVLSSKNLEELEIVESFLLFLSKTGNNKTLGAIIQVNVSKVSIAVRSNMKRKIDKSVYSQIDNSLPGDAVTSVIKAISSLIK